MTVPYEDAVATLQGMFSNLDREVVCSVLHANRGHMERTIDSLLSLCGETPVNNVPSENPPVHQSVNQVQQDEMLARMLQNDMFMREVRVNRDFNALFSAPSRQDIPPRSSSPSVVDALEDDLSLRELREKFSQLGEAAKLKFREVAMKFTKRDGGAGNASYSPLNKSRDGTDDDTEVVAFDSSVARRTKKALDVTESPESSPSLEDKRLARPKREGDNKKDK